jgi:hypothetical protein
MRKRAMPVVVLMSVMQVIAFGQRASDSDDALLDLLVWGRHVTIDPTGYDPDVRFEIEQHVRRFTAYQSKRPVPRGSEMRMVHSAWVHYERLLAAASSAPDASALAASYVDRLRPCYEWEGYHDCREREAVFADEHRANHPGGPFSHLLPLLSAHRWLCTAEVFDYERRPKEAARSRGMFVQRIAAARASGGAMIRVAAERLSARGRCHSLR